jgi:hypothetical protein
VLQVWPELTLIIERFQTDKDSLFRESWGGRIHRFGDWAIHVFLEFELWCEIACFGGEHRVEDALTESRWPVHE